MYSHPVGSALSLDGKSYLKAGGTYCAYLPLAHIMEMIVETGLYALGARVGFGSPHTLTPTGVKLKFGTCEGDAAALGPTMMVTWFATVIRVRVRQSG